MLKRITIVFILLLPLVVLMPKPVIAEPLQIHQIQPQTTKDLVRDFVSVYGGNENLINKMIDCESSGKENAIGDEGLSRGIAQFQKPTFKWLSSKMGIKLNYTSTYDQLKLLVWSVANGHGSNWTSYVAIKRGGEYSFYSTQLHKHFTVYCKL